jgi:hypothetical protein
VPNQLKRRIPWQRLAFPYPLPPPLAPFFANVFNFIAIENIILAHYWCLIEWIIPTSPTTIPRLSTPTVLSKLLEVVELGYYGAKVLVWGKQKINKIK